MEHEQDGREHAGYGEYLLDRLSQDLTAEFGKGYSKRNLELVRKFYLTYRNAKSPISQNISWTHYLQLMRISNEDERNFYEVETAANNWIVRELTRQINSYKDAIRRTGGAYVLYPGDQSSRRPGFHEIIPGLGAFPVRPSKTDSGIGELKGFILEIIEHFINRASQREKIAFRTFDVYKTRPDSEDIINEPLPETYGNNRGLIPDDTFVLVGYYHSPQQYDWIKKHKLYNLRMGSGSGSLVLDKERVISKYLLLHTGGDPNSGDLWRIISDGPKVFSKADMIRKGYPSPSQDNYLVIELEPVTDTDFEKVKWNFRKLKNYSSGRASAFPFTASLTELMRNKAK